MKTIIKNFNPRLFLVAAAGVVIAGLFYIGSCSKEGNPGPNQVFMQGTSFNPSSITVAPNTTITWLNKGSLTHTATSDTAGVFSSGDVVPGASYSFKFTSPGTYPYYCVYHVSMGMVGTVIVK